MLSQGESIFTLARSKISSGTTGMVCGVSCFFLTIWSRVCMVCLSGGILDTWFKISKAQKHRKTWHRQPGSGEIRFFGLCCGKEKIWKCWMCFRHQFRWCTLHWQESKHFYYWKVLLLSPHLFSGDYPKQWKKWGPQSHLPPQTCPLALIQGTANAQGWRYSWPILNWADTMVHQHAEAKTECVWTSFSQHHYPNKAFFPE